MKLVLSLICLCAGSIAFSAERGYNLQIELSQNGQHIASPRISVGEGKTAMVTQENDGKTTFIEVVAKDRKMKSKTAIDMQFTIGTIDANGKKTVTNSPNIITLENQKAEMTVGDDKEALSLDVTASRTNL